MPLAYPGIDTNISIGKGKTYAELDVLFEKKISARKFKTYVVDPFDATDDTWDVPK